jgi:cellulose synthase/poly-beta-1,6-N-acetylglucosamine synthase-like glycosyltransferase
MIELLLCLAVMPLLLPALALLILTLAARPYGPAPASLPLSGATPRPGVAVLVPAHDESVHLLPTIKLLRRQLAPRDRLLVIADNCSDDTAAVARQAGAEVAERHDLQRRGKGYALAFGVDQMRADPRDVVMVFDADCLPDEGSVDALARACQVSGRPVQMLNLMSPPAGSGLRIRVIELAMVMKNLVRSLGTQRLGGVCHLSGTGMALPWTLMAGARLATGHVAEDMHLGVELARAGRGPIFLPQSRVRSAMVSDPAVARVQKARWEHGHLDTLRQHLPPLARDALRQRSRALGALALDLCIPPVALYFTVLVALLALSAAAAWAWPSARPAAMLVAAGAAAFAAAIVKGWWQFGRHTVQARELLLVPIYALWKLPVYAAYFVGRRSAWVRTQRADSGDGHGTVAR